MKGSTDFVLVSCEHGGNLVPGRYARLFRRRQRLLQSHRGWDAGALLLARELAAGLNARLEAATTTRLLVDLNRSPRHPGLFSICTRDLDPAEKRHILERWYLPYRNAVENAVASALKKHRRVIHLSIHSFTPALDGEERHADVSLLYDPARSGELAFSSRVLEELSRREPHKCLRRNYPYRGTADGLTTHLRKRFPKHRYLGIEVEVNQRHAALKGPKWAGLRRSIRDSIGASI